MYCWHLNREIDRKRDREDDELGLTHNERRRLTRAAPTRQELGLIPWAGDGPDPLLQEFS